MVDMQQNMLNWSRVVQNASAWIVTWEYSKIIRVSRLVQNWNGKALNIYRILTEDLFMFCNIEHIVVNIHFPYNNIDSNTRWMNACLTKSSYWGIYKSTYHELQRDWRTKKSKLSTFRWFFDKYIQNIDWKCLLICLKEVKIYKLLLLDHLYDA